MITIENYTERSVVVRGETKPYAPELKAMGGRWNSSLSGGSGWIFSVEREGELRSWLNNITPKREEKQTVPPTPVKSNREVTDAFNQILNVIEESKFSYTQRMTLIHALSTPSNVNRRLNMDE